MSEPPGFVAPLAVPLRAHARSLRPRHARAHARPTRRRVRTIAQPPTAVASVQADVDAPPSLNALLANTEVQRYIFVGGKGGVGKTSTSCATALALAEQGNCRVLLISTDPAHSVSDSLDLPMKPGEMVNVELSPQSTGRLDAIEVDTSEAVAEFRALVKSIAPTNDGAGGNDGWRAIADKVKLSDFADVLDTIPPGADELIALVRVLDLAREGEYDRVVIDTAPTGHTLRLLAFPDFLEKFLEKAIALRERLEGARGVISGIANVFMATTGAKIDKQAMAEGLADAMEKVQKYRTRMLELSDLFRDPERAEFIVVTIPTEMAVAESTRLIDRLWDDGVWCRHVVVNQVLPGGAEAGDKDLEPYLKRMRTSQATHMAFATEVLADEFGLAVHPVPMFDTEVRGIHALRALSSVAYTAARKKRFGRLFDPPETTEEMQDALFAFVGGKGGVGKTTSSASMAVALAEQGHKTLVLSTDPAHSLADAFDHALGGAPTPLDDDGLLYGMEIDAAAAVREFQELVADFARQNTEGMAAEVSRTLGVQEFADLLDNAPPGIDELVALTQVVDIVKYGDFTRVVVDTAPTGHTLRLLAFPEFLDGLLGKVVRLKNRLDSAISALKGVFGRGEGAADAMDTAAKRIDQFRANMAALRALIVDPHRTQFVVVTIPSKLAMAESERLLYALDKDGVKCRNLIVNQVVPDTEAARFVRRVADKQEGCIDTVAEAGAKRRIALIRVPAFDAEVRGIYALRAMGGVLFRSAA